MAENKETKVLIDVEVKAKEALTNLAKLKIQAEALKEDHESVKKAMDAVNTSTKEGAERYVELRAEYESVGQEIKALNTRALEYQKEIQSNIKYEHEQEGSLQRLKSELSLNTAAYNKLSEAERNTVKGSALAKQIQETTAKLKEEEEALGNHRRSVGDYAKAGQSLRGEIKELANTLVAMKLNGEENSKQYKEMTVRLAELRDAYKDVNQGANELASDTNKLDAASQSLSLLTASFSIYATLVGLSANEEKEFAEVMKNMTVAMTALATLTQIQNIIQKQSIVHRIAERLNPYSNGT